MALAGMPADSPVLLVKLDGLGPSGSVGEPGVEAMFAKALLSQLAPPVPDLLRGPHGLELQPSSRLAFCGGQELNLTSTEFSLLQELLSRDGSVASVDDLSRAIWGHDTLGAPNYVEAHISRLRRKLRDVGAGRVIETVRGSGYRVRQARVAATSMPTPPAREPMTMQAPERMRSFETRDAA
jgi:DNA-binding winged helix-turn-helix (wHTH) protein